MEKLNIDCLILIFHELQEYKYKGSLYSCLLVSKEWCQLVVPILWNDYPNFFRREGSEEKCSNIILSCLTSSSRQFLSDNNIRLPQTILSKTSLTFNYISFFKFLKAKIVDNITNMVFKEEILNKVDYSKKRKLLRQEIYKLLISECERIRGLSWQTSQPLPLFPGALKCFSQLYHLSINLNFVNSNNLYEMAQICKGLNTLYIENCSQDVPGLNSLIDSQRNLKSVKLSFQTRERKFEELSKSLARKGRTINDLTLNSSIGVIQHSFLTSFINLEDLTIDFNNNACGYYGKVEGEKFHKCLVNSKFPVLRSLIVSDELSCFKELAMLIEKTKGNILNVAAYTYNKDAENTGMLLKAISNHCPKIENLCTYLGPEDLDYFKSLLMKCKNLKDLHLNSLNAKDNVGDKLLDILIKFSPKSLTDITISGYWEYSIDMFENFFESYRERNLLCFDIDHHNERFSTITTKHINVACRYFYEGVVKSSNLLEDEYGLRLDESDLQRFLKIKSGVI